MLFRNTNPGPVVLEGKDLNRVAINIQLGCFIMNLIVRTILIWNNISFRNTLDKANK